MKEQLEKQNNKLNEININKEDELIKYKKYLKENNFPCFEFLLNPYNEVKYIPPTYLQEKQKWHAINFLKHVCLILLIRNKTAT